MFYATILSFFMACAYVAALPVMKRVVYSPAITSPEASTTWTTGQTETVTWDTSDIPQNITSPVGMLVLGYLEDGDPSYHLMLDSPLAKDINLVDGKVDITVPDVDSKSSYFVVLFGDSGNKSPEFTINGGGGASSSGSSSAALTTSQSESGTTSSAVVAPTTTTTVTAPSSSAETEAPASSEASSSSQTFLETTLSVPSPAISSSEEAVSTVIVAPSGGSAAPDSGSSTEDGSDGALSLTNAKLGLTIPIAVVLACLL